MLSSILVIGLAAAEAAAAPPPPKPTAVEISFVTHVGEGAAGGKRFMRDGCYQVESGGSTGGAGYARTSQAGCHLPADVAAVFARLAAIGGDALVRDDAGRAGATGGARGAGLLGGESQTRVVLIRSDGSRWVAANQATADDILRAVNELPSENQWYATPPSKSIGTGGQLVVLAVAGQSKRTEAALAADGRWWCHRSVVGDRGGEPKLPAKRVVAVPDAPARLTRILAGASRGGRDEDKTAPGKRPDRVETSVEVAWPGVARSPLRPKSLADTVADRFGAEMHALSPACAIAPAPGSR
jgi:hypothetical protein